MADIRHCDREGCTETEPCSNPDGFLTMSPMYRGHPVLRYCSWRCLAADAMAHADQVAADKAKSQAMWAEIARSVEAGGTRS